MSRRVRHRFGSVAAVLAATLIVVGCGADDEPAASRTSSPPVATTTPSSTPSPSSTLTPAGGDVAQPVVPAVLKFTGRTVDGASFEGGSVAGKPVVLWFWAPWCAVCRSQAPDVEALAAAYGDDLAVIGIGSLDSGSAIAGFADDVRGPVHLSDPDGDLWKRFRIAQQSSFVVLDADGEEVLRTGYNDDDAVAATVKKLVG